MKFEERKIADAEGWSLAHSLITGQQKWPKATLLTPEICVKITEQGINKVQVFKLENDDITEDAAAHLAANTVAGSGVNVVIEGRGRANLIANHDGIFIPGNAIDVINQLDDAFSAASLPAYHVVSKGQLIATIKLIPYGIERRKIAALDVKNHKASVVAFSALHTTLISTGPKITDKSLDALKARIERLGGTVSALMNTSHDIETVADLLKRCQNTETDIIMLLGASAISDKRDVIPAALTQVGGSITKLGLPTDPGNLLMLGTLGDKHVIGLPGCARSPALNGFDWVLERLFAGVGFDHHSLTMMGTGGLLKEMSGRRVPRIEKKPPTNKSNIGALILAAGTASRAQGTSKLLSMFGSQTVIEATLAGILQQSLSEVVIVTGHNAEKLQPCLNGKNITVAHNEHYQNGMGSSLSIGARTMSEKNDYIMICLADMPFVRTETYKALLMAAHKADPGAILVPTFNSKRGHPVVWHQRYFAELAHLSGDTGGKYIMQRSSAAIIEVPVDDPAILIDLDTPEMLDQFGIKPVAQ